MALVVAVDNVNYFVTVSDTTTLTDAQNANIGYIGVISESIIAVESSTPRTDYNPAVNELVTVLDTIIRRGWVKVDTSDSWSAVNNAQPSTWVPINIWKKD